MEPHSEELKELKAQFETARANGRMQDAYEIALQGHLMNRSDVWFVNAVHLTLTDSGRSEEALDFLLTIADICGDELQYLTQVASVNLHLGDHSKAEALCKEFEHVSAEDRPCEVNLLNLELLHKCGRFVEIPEFVSSNYFRPQHMSIVWSTTCDSAYFLDQWAMLEAALVQLEALHGPSPISALHRSRLLRQKGQPQEALGTIDMVITLGQHQFALQAEKANCLINLNRLSEAKALLMTLYRRFPDQGIVCFHLASMPLEHFNSGEPTPEMFLDRGIYLMHTNRPVRMLPHGLLEHLYKRNRTLPFCLLQEHSPTALLVENLGKNDALRSAMPFIHHIRTLRPALDHMSELAHLIIQQHMDFPGACYAGIDDNLMAREIEPNAIQDYYYAMSAAQIIEDHSAVAPAALARARATIASTTAMPTDLYYALLLVTLYGGSEEALARLGLLRSDPRWNVLLHLLELRLRSEGDPDLLQTTEGSRALKALTEHMRREKGCYFLNPTPVRVPKHGRDVLEPLTPLFQFMENLELLSHVSEFVRAFQKDQALNEIYFVRGSIFARLLEFEAYEEVRALGLVDPDLEGFTPAAVSWVGRQLNSPSKNLDIDALVQARKDPPEVLLRDMGLAVFNSANGTRHRREESTVADTLKCVTENYTLCTALLQHDRIDIEQCLLFQHYCQYALEHLVRTDTSAVEKELKGKLDDALLDLLKQLDIIGNVLELALGPIRPFYWICAKGIKAITMTLGVEVIGDKFLSFDQYSEYVKARRSKEAA